MPMPFHCMECDKPVQQPLRGLCPKCKNEHEQKRMVSSTKIGTKMKLPSDVGQSEDT